MDNLKNKVVAITGASSGIGKATAVLLAENGAKVVLGARRKERLEELAQTIIENGGEVVFQQTDVRNADEVKKLIQLACESFGKLDVLVSNAGISPISPFAALRVQDWENMIDVNLKGVLYGIAAALPIFRDQGSGHFVNTVSTAGIQIVPTMGVYAATKNAVRTLAEALRQESKGLYRVTNISPGYVQTELSSSLTDPEIQQQIESNMGTMAMPPEAIARAIVYAIEQPDSVDVGDIVIRPASQS